MMDEYAADMLCYQARLIEARSRLELAASKAQLHDVRRKNDVVLIGADYSREKDMTVEAHGFMRDGVLHITKQAIK
jgi:hypothetical protein